MLTHINKDGRAHMVDISDKTTTKRFAKASGKIFLNEKTIKLINEDNIPKGNVLNTAQVAGIMAVKKTSELIPMCHGLNVASCDIEFKINENNIEVICSVVVSDKTGIEMEALTGTSIALLTIYDMCKAVDKTMEISEISLLEKKGGKSGHYIKEENNG